MFKLLKLDRLAGQIGGFTV